jgi:hypothetical protein
VVELITCESYSIESASPKVVDPEFMTHDVDLGQIHVVGGEGGLFHGCSPVEPPTDTQITGGLLAAVVLGIP